MRVFLLSLALSLALAACSPSVGTGARLVDSPDGYAEAVRSGDSEAALQILDAAADAGHLGALATLADAHQRGYLSVPGNEDGTVHLPIRSWPWTAPLASRRYERAVRARADDGDPDAWFLIADGYVAQAFADGAWATPEADMDSARAIYRRLVATDADPLRLAILAQRVGDEDAYRAHLATAAAGGNSQACIFQSWAERSGTSRFDVGALAAFIDRTEGCRALAPERDRDATLYTYGTSAVQTLRSEAEAGNAAAVATLDSLRATGVFDRHPALAPHANA